MAPEATDSSPPSSIHSDSLPPSPPPLRLTASSVNASGAAVPVPNSRDLHLTPCTWESLRDLRPDPRIEVVDGIIVYRDDMGTGSGRHQLIATTFRDYLSVALKNCTVGGNNDVECAPIDSATSSPPTRRRRRHSNQGIAQSSRADNTGQDDRPERINLRVPDVFIMQENTSSSSGSPDRKKPVTAKLGECMVAIEVTSSSTRKVDMEAKWVQYARSGIEIYMIIDIQPLDGLPGVPTVIVGSLGSSPGARRAPTGYPGEYRSSRQDRQRAPRYFKREYNGDESIALPSSLDINWPPDSITPRLLGDYKAITRLTKGKRAEIEQERQRRFEAEENVRRAEENVRRAEEKCADAEEKCAHAEENLRRERRGRNLVERRCQELEEQIRKLKGESRGAGSSDRAAPRNDTRNDSATGMGTRSRRRPRGER